VAAEFSWNIHSTWHQSRLIKDCPYPYYKIIISFLYYAALLIITGNEHNKYIQVEYAVLILIVLPSPHFA